MPPDGNKLAYKFSRMSEVAFRVEQERSVVDSALIFTLKKMEKSFAQVLSLWRSNLLKIRRGWSQHRRCLEHARKTIESCRATENTTLAYNTS